MFHSELQQFEDCADDFVNMVMKAVKAPEVTAMCRIGLGTWASAIADSSCYSTQLRDVISGSARV